MCHSMIRALLIPGLVLSAALTPLSAHGQSVRVLGDHNAWSSYTTTESAGKICFAMSQPTTTDPEPDGYGDAHFYITHRVNDGPRSELNLVAGYEFAPESTANMSIGGQSFALYTQGDSAWLADTGQTAAANQAIRAGSTMVIEGTTTRGIKVRQTFSLMGATAASRAIDAEC